MLYSHTSCERCITFLLEFSTRDFRQEIWDSYEYGKRAGNRKFRQVGKNYSSLKIQRLAKNPSLNSYTRFSIDECLRADYPSNLARYDLASPYSLLSLCYGRSGCCKLFSAFAWDANFFMKFNIRANTLVLWLNLKRINQHFRIIW